MDDDLDPEFQAILLSSLMSDQPSRKYEESSSDEDQSNIGAQAMSQITSPLRNLQISHPKNTLTSRSTPRVIQNMNELAAFGQFVPLDVTNFTFQIIEKYVQNSHGLPLGADAQIYNVYELISSDDTMPIKPSAPQMNKPSGTEGSEQMLLWLKTTPAGIKKLAQGTDGCVAFYDRICRAFIEKPEDLKSPLRQIILLCEVSLGNVCKDMQGYQAWSQVGQAPPGYDTVKGIGSFCPDWNEDYCQGFVIFPCGRTVKQQGSRKYEIDFNEYIVFERNRIKVKYAVELELIPNSYFQKSKGTSALDENSSDEVESSTGVPSGSNSSFPNATPQTVTGFPTFSSVNQPSVSSHQTYRVKNNLPQNNLRRGLSNAGAQQKPILNYQRRPHTPNHTSLFSRNNMLATKPNSTARPSFPFPTRNISTTVPNSNPKLTQIPSQRLASAPSSSAGTPVPTLNTFSRNTQFRPNPPLPVQSPYKVHLPSSQTKKGSVDPPALKILMQLPGATSAAFQASLFKAQIITPTDEIYNHIHTYIRNSSVHNYKLKPLSIIRIVRHNDFEFEHDPNMKGKKRMLLWHGTKDNVVAGILQTGFQIPAAKNQMFGTGIYFADRASKSANYCTHTKPPAIGYLLLCDVVIGNPYNSLNAKNNFTAPPTTTSKSGATKYFDSLKCTGEYIPDRNENVYYNGAVIPLGKTIKNTKYQSYTVKYNEFIVYDSKQVRIKYLVKVQFS